MVAPGDDSRKAQGDSSSIYFTSESGQVLALSCERLRSSCCLVGLLNPAAVLMAPSSALGDVTFMPLTLLLFLFAPSNLGLPKPVMRPLLLLGTALPPCELMEVALLLLPPKPWIRLCSRGEVFRLGLLQAELMSNTSS